MVEGFLAGNRTRLLPCKSRTERLFLAGNRRGAEEDRLDVASHGPRSVGIIVCPAADLQGRLRMALGRRSSPVAFVMALGRRGRLIGQAASLRGPDIVERRIEPILGRPGRSARRRIAAST